MMVKAVERSAEPSRWAELDQPDTHGPDHVLAIGGKTKEETYGTDCNDPEARLDCLVYGP